MRLELLLWFLIAIRTEVCGDFSCLLGGVQERNLDEGGFGQHMTQAQWFKNVMERIFDFANKVDTNVNTTQWPKFYGPRPMKLRKLTEPAASWKFQPTTTRPRGLSTVPARRNLWKILGEFFGGNTQTPNLPGRTYKGATGDDYTGKAAQPPSTTPTRVHHSRETIIWTQIGGPAIIITLPEALEYIRTTKSKATKRTKAEDLYRTMKKIRTSAKLDPGLSLESYPFYSDCDVDAQHCLRAYTTGPVCGKSFFHHYHTFKNYCLLNYVNCEIKAEVWWIQHIGPCYQLRELSAAYEHTPYLDDYFLDENYLFADN